MGTNNIARFAAVLSVVALIGEQSELYSLYSDVFKSYEGIRPRWAYDWSVADLQAALAALDARDGFGPGCECPECMEGEIEPPMPTSGDGWSFQPACDACGAVEETCGGVCNPCFVNAECERSYAQPEA